MKTKTNKKGFTLVELLIVVAIIAVLVAISIPIFSTQLEKSREATDLANVRNAYAQVRTAAMTGDDGMGEVNKSGSSYYIIVPLKQKQDDWQTTGTLNIGGVSSEDDVHWLYTPEALGACKLMVTADGTTYINWNASIITMLTTPEKESYAPTLNAVLNVLKNEAVDVLRQEGLHVGYILIGGGEVKAVSCYDKQGSTATPINGFDAEELAALNTSITNALSKESYRIASNEPARIFFDYDGNIISGKDENGKNIGIGGQGAGASIKLCAPKGANVDATTLRLTIDDIWK